MDVLGKISGVILGLIVIYALCSMFYSLVTELVATYLLHLRSKKLEEGIRKRLHSKHLARN